MNLTEARPNALYDRAERATARFARIARCDAWHGGAIAMVKLRRLKRSANYRQYDAAVSQAYASSTGTAPDYLAYECPECGSARLGQDAAYACCAEAFAFDDEEATQ